MSAINQVMEDFKTRVAESLPGEYAIRVVHLAENRRKAVLLIGGVVVLLCVAAWMGWRWQHKTPAPASLAQAPAKIISAPKELSKPVEITQSVSAVEAEAAQQETVLPKESEQKANVLVPSINSASGVVQQPDNVHIKPHIAIIDQSQHVPLVPSIATAEKKPRHRARITLADTTNNTVDQKEAHQPADVAAESKNRHAAPAQISAAGNKLDKHTKQLSVQQQADNEFRKANGLMQQGHVDEAITGYEAALRLDAGHDAARQAMVALLLENKRNAEAEGVLQEGLNLNLKNSNFAMVLARLQVERDASWSALLTLQKTLPYAIQQADYQAFVAALLQRLNRHKEAVMHYQKALQLAPNTSVWLMGMGISLQAMQRKEEARDAFKRAIELHTLSADLQEFVTRRLKEI